MADDLTKRLREYDCTCKILREAATEIASQRAEREKLDRLLRTKDEAMGVLFGRLHAAGVDCSDLIS